MFYVENLTLESKLFFRKNRKLRMFFLYKLKLKSKLVRDFTFDEIIDVVLSLFHVSVQDYIDLEKKADVIMAKYYVSLGREGFVVMDLLLYHVSFRMWAMERVFEGIIASLERETGC